MSELDYSIGTSRTPLNIQPGISNYFQGRQLKIAQGEADANAEKEKKQKTIADIVSRSTSPEGELDQTKMSSELLKRGWLDDDLRIKSELRKQAASIAEAQEKKQERDGTRMAGFADYYLNAPDKQVAYQHVLEAMEHERIPMPEEWGLEATPQTDQVMDMISTRYGKKSQVKNSTAAKPDFVKGENGNFWVASPDGTMRDTGNKFYKEPKEPRQEPQGTLLRNPGQLPMMVKNGVASPIAGAPADPDKPDQKVTDSQSAAALYGKRMQQSMLDMASLEKAGFDRASPISGTRAKLPNVMQSEEGQRQEQAERNFINAVLRRESGAVISPEEFANAAKQYFPRSGDAKATKEQKKRNREQALEGLKSASGKAWEGVKLVTESKTTKPDEEEEYQAWKKAQGK